MDTLVARRIAKGIASFAFFCLIPIITYKPAYDYTIIKDVLGALFVAAIGILMFTDERSFEKQNGTLWVAAAFFGWILIGAWYAPIGHGAALAMENYLLYLLLFLVGVFWSWEQEDLLFFSFGAVVPAIIAIAQRFILHQDPVTTFGNKNFFAGFLLMPLFLSFLFWKRKWRVYSILFGIFTFLGLIAANSQASIIAFLAGLIIAIYLSIDWENPALIRKWFIIGTAAITAIITPFIIKSISTDIRLFIWKGTLKLIYARPFTGWGTGNFLFFYPYYRFRPYFLRPEATPITLHPHCHYLSILSENGLIGFLLFALLLTILLIKGFRERKSSSKPMVFLLPAIIALLLDNILSTNFSNTSTSIYFWFLLGTLAALSQKPSQTVSEEKPRPSMPIFDKKLFTMLIAIAGLFLGGWKWLYRIIPDIYLRDAIAYREQNNFSNAVKNYNQACEINPYHYVALYKLGYVYGQMGELRKALETYQGLTKNVFPHFAKIDSNMASLYLSLGEVAQAKYYFGVAHWFNPYDEDVLCSLASIALIYQKDPKVAAHYLREVLAFNPYNRYANSVLRDIGTKKEKPSKKY